jgi:uncharacterized membrane protein YoaK (UPF0700 family)
MIRLGPRDRAYAVCLAALAGYVDAIGFVVSGGFFVSFMSGNSTRLGVGIAGDAGAAIVAAALIVAFIAGVAAGALAGHAAGLGRGRAVLILVAALLATAATCGMAGVPPLWTALPLAAAMGAENTVFEAKGDAGIGLTYMTGALVKVGQGLAAILSGAPAGASFPNLLLWTGLVSGVVLGALLQPLLGPVALWPPAVAALLLAFVPRVSRTA